MRFAHPSRVAFQLDEVEEWLSERQEIAQQLRKRLKEKRLLSED